MAASAAEAKAKGNAALAAGKFDEAEAFYTEVRLVLVARRAAEGRAGG